VNFVPSFDSSISQAVHTSFTDLVDLSGFACSCPCTSLAYLAVIRTVDQVTSLRPSSYLVASSSPAYLAVKHSVACRAASFQAISHTASGLDSSCIGFTFAHPSILAIQVASASSACFLQFKLPFD